MKIETTILLTDSRHTKNASISIQVRNFYHTKNGLVQPSAVEVEITPQGARTLIAHLQQVLTLADETDYIIHNDGNRKINGVDYDNLRDYLDDKPSAN